MWMKQANLLWHSNAIKRMNAVGQPITKASRLEFKVDSESQLQDRAPELCNLHEMIVEGIPSPEGIEGRTGMHTYSIMAFAWYPLEVQRSIYPNKPFKAEGTKLLSLLMHNVLYSEEILTESNGAYSVYAVGMLAQPCCAYGHIWELHESGGGDQPINPFCLWCSKHCCCSRDQRLSKAMSQMLLVLSRFTQPWQMPKSLSRHHTENLWYISIHPMNTTVWYLCFTRLFFSLSQATFLDVHWKQSKGTSQIWCVTHPKSTKQPTQ